MDTTGDDRLVCAECTARIPWHEAQSGQRCAIAATDQDGVVRCLLCASRTWTIAARERERAAYVVPAAVLERKRAEARDRKPGERRRGSDADRRPAPRPAQAS